MILADQYVIPDIHGCIHTLVSAIETFIDPGQADELYFLGDFINKGPDSKSVLDYVMTLEEKGYHVTAVRGNHEQLLLDALENRNAIPAFLSKGGDTTLQSFGVNDVHRIPGKYINFIEGLDYFLELESFFIVHAGFNFTVADPLGDFMSMLTIRDYPVKPEMIGMKKIIHGHNATLLDDILEGILGENEHTINLDNGCVYAGKEGVGNLIILDLTDLSFYIQPCLD